MSSQITQFILGKTPASYLRQQVLQITTKLKELATPIIPRLDVILVGDDPASELYVHNKHEAGRKVGVVGTTHRLAEHSSKDLIASLIKQLNQDPQVHGIILQLPLPLHLQADTKELMQLISSRKDADAFTPYCLGEIFLGTNTTVSCTAHGVIQMIRYAYLKQDLAAQGFSDTEIEEQLLNSSALQELPDLSGKHVCVVGQSNIVGKPLSLELINLGATISCANKYLASDQLKLLTRSADIVVLATGALENFGEEYFSEHTLIIDVGIGKLANPEYNPEFQAQVASLTLEQQLAALLEQEPALASLSLAEQKQRLKQLISPTRTTGDVKVAEVKDLTSNLMITSSPGGVGLLTVANLLQNTVKLCLQQHNLDPAEYFK